MSDLKQCREAFEYWFSDEGESPRAIIRSGDSYRLAAACSAWNAWQACWAARTQPEATAPAQDLSAAILKLQPEVPNLMTPNRAYRDGFIACRTAAAALASSANALVAGDRVDAPNVVKLTDEQYLQILEPVLSRYGMQRYLNGDEITLDPSDYRAIIDAAILQSQKGAE